MGFFIMFWLMIAYFVILGLFKVKTDGTLYLEHLGSPVTIRREEDNGIPHVRAQDMKGAYYGQGFVHAQTRLF